MEFLILTGMSGAGKGTAGQILEDMGYLCVDNMPFSLIETCIDLYKSSSIHEKSALLWTFADRRSSLS